MKICCFVQLKDILMLFPLLIEHHGRKVKVYGRLNRHKGELLGVVGFMDVTMWSTVRAWDGGNGIVIRRICWLEGTHLEGIKCHLFESGIHQTICFISQGAPILEPPGFFGSYCYWYSDNVKPPGKNFLLAVVYTKSLKVPKSLSQKEDKTYGA